MAEKDIVNAVEEESIETYEFTDENGIDHCFVVESRFKVDKDDYVALIEVDPAIFAEDEECGCGHDHVHDAACGCRHDHSEDEEEEEETNIILARIVTDENGEVDIQVPSDDEFEKARQVYENLEE